jgi:hypothetical protein
MTLGRRFLLVDARTVASAEGVQVRLGSAVKDPGNPLFVADRAWEPRYDNLYANLVYDRQEGLYTCWYSPFIVDPGTRLVPPAERRRRAYPAEAMGPREMGVCYAFSRDGLEWEKPPLALHLWEGRPSNIVARGPHGAGVFRDEREPDPARRYKMICREPAGMAARFSPDGLVWSQPLLLEGLVAEGDTHNNAFWAPTLGRYVCITRQWEHRAEGPVRGVRLVARSESEDFVHWSPATEICRGVDDWQQLYAMPVWYHAGVYLGLPAVFDLRTDRVHTEFCWSPDTLHWHRIEPGTPLLAPSPRRGRYDWGCVYAAACPVVLPGEVRLYYGASDDTHMSWRQGGLALARLRADGFAGYVAGDQPGRLTTQPIPWAGGPVLVTAHVSRAGSVQVTALDTSGAVVARAAPLRRSVTDAVLNWERAPLAGGQVVRLCFALARAQVFSFALAD